MIGRCAMIGGLILASACGQQARREDGSAAVVAGVVGAKATGSAQGGVGPTTPTSAMPASPAAPAPAPGGG